MSSTNSLNEMSEMESWKVPLQTLSSHSLEGKTSKEIKKYYKQQNLLMRAIRNVEQYDGKERKKEGDNRWMGLIFSLNVLLLAGKIAATIFTKSLTILSSSMDSAIDILTLTVLFVTNRLKQKKDLRKYPFGRKSLGTVGILILSVAMVMASLQVIAQSIVSVVSGDIELKLDRFSIGILSSTIGSKLILFLLLFRSKKEIFKTIGKDSFNDVATNSFTLICVYVVSKGVADWNKNWKFMDPICAIVISSYIVVGWVVTCLELIKRLTGITADSHFVQRLSWICLNHHKAIKSIDTVKGFHFGDLLIAEVHVVLPEDMDLRTAHDIGESLQLKLERFEDVQIAFVHLDYESDHNPLIEHVFK